MLARELVRLIGFNSVWSRGNGPLAAHVARMMEKAGFRVKSQRVRWHGRAYFNIIGLKGPAARPLLMCAHMDTVPAGDPKKWTRTGGKPWKAAVRGSRVWGLGAADDKASLLAMVRAGASVHASSLRKPLMLLATFNEECGMQGANAFTGRWKGPKPFLALVGEPTSLDVTYRHKGMGVLELEIFSRHKAPSGARRVLRFKGKQGHSSRPATGINALVKAADEILRPENRGKWVASLTGGVSANVIPGSAELVFAGRGGFPAAVLAAVFCEWRGTVRSEKKRDASFDPALLTSNFGVAETAPGRMKFSFDFRLLPGQNLEAVRRKIAGQLRRAVTDKRIRLRLEVERNNPPLGLAAGSPAVRLVKSALEKSGHKPRLVTKPSCTEAGVYAAWGVPAVIFGPGQAAGNIHAPNESVDLREIEKASVLYRSLIRRLCGGQP